MALVFRLVLAVGKLSTNVTRRTEPLQMPYLSRAAVNVSFLSLICNWSLIRWNQWIASILAASINKWNSVYAVAVPSNAEAVHGPILTNVAGIILLTPGLSNITQPIVSMTTLNPTPRPSFPIESVASHLATSDVAKPTRANILALSILCLELALQFNRW